MQIVKSHYGELKTDLAENQPFIAVSIGTNRYSCEHDMPEYTPLDSGVNKQGLEIEHHLLRYL